MEDMEIKNLDIKTMDSTKQYKLVKEVPKDIIKGAVKGAGFAGVVNTVFPALIPTFAGIFTGASSLSVFEKALMVLGLDSSPVVQIYGLVIIGIGAAAGALIGAGYTLVKGVKYRSAEKKAKAKVK